VVKTASRVAMLCGIAVQLLTGVITGEAGGPDS